MQKFKSTSLPSINQNFTKPIVLTEILMSSAISKNLLLLSISADRWKKILILWNNFVIKITASPWRCSIERVGGEAGRGAGSCVVGTWSKLQCRRTTFDLSGSCSVAPNQDNNLGWTHCATEQTIWKVVREKLNDSTVITTAHRLDTIKDCVVILVMKNGEIDEIDSFESLVNDMLWYLIFSSKSGYTTIFFFFLIEFPSRVFLCFKVFFANLFH